MDIKGSKYISLYVGVKVSPLVGVDFWATPLRSLDSTTTVFAQIPSEKNLIYLYLDSYPKIARKKNWTSRENVRGALSFLKTIHNNIIMWTKEKEQAKFACRTTNKRLTSPKHKRKDLIKWEQWCFYELDKPLYWILCLVLLCSLCEILQSRTAGQAMP